MENLLKKQDRVKKKSGKPFKNGNLFQDIMEFSINESDPKRRISAVFNDGSICSVELLEKI